MSNPVFLLETDTFLDDNPEAIAAILDEKGIKWSYIKYIPLLGGIEFVKPSKRYHLLAKHYVPHHFDQNPFFAGRNHPAIFYGSLNGGKYLQETYPDVKPMVWMDLQKFLCQTYYVHYSQFLLGQEYLMMPVDEVYRRQDFIFNNFGRDGRVFIRPDRGDKPFNGEVVSREEMDNWFEYTKKYDDNPYKLAVVARPVDVATEWRLVIMNGKVVAGSQYRKMVDGRSSVEWEEGYPPEVAAYAQNIVEVTGWVPHRIFIMDIAESAGKLHLVEIGAVNTCGLYSCNLRNVVNAMIEAAEVDQYA